MRRKSLYLWIFVLFLASCEREREWDGTPDIKAKVESEQKTRTSISVDESGAGTIYWNPSDRIDVFFGTKKAQYTSQNASDAIAATFKTSDSVSGSDVSSTNIWGLYPSNSSSSCNGSSITTTLPSTQYGVPNTFDKDIFPAVAHSSSTNLQFYNVCGGIKFNMAYDDIKKVTFKGNNNENIAGTVSITFTSGVPTATVTSGVKQITLTPKSGSTFTKGTDYYITLLPGTLSKGFTMTFTATDGTVGTLNYTDASVTIKRSIFGRKGNMDVYAAFTDERQPNNVIYYTSAGGQVVTPYKTDVFGANIVSNEYVGGRGIITFDGDVTSIGSHAFEYCRGLTSIEIPNSVTSIGYGAFGGCISLISIEIPNSVTRIGRDAFWGCSGLTSIEIPNSVTSIDFNPFSECNGLSSIIVENGNPVYDSRNGCNAIIKTSTNELVSGCKNTIIPNSVTSIGESAFLGCSGLTSIEIPNSVTIIYSQAFSGCSDLTSIVIPNSVTSIYGLLFSECNGLSSIIVENGNPVYDSRNGCNAIIETSTNELVQGCKNTIIPNSVSSIASGAFHNCIGLTSIEIPNSVTSIGEHAFSYCSGLTSIKVYSLTPPALEPNVFTNTDNCPIYVPAQSVNAYKTADGWSKYADRIQAIPDTHEAVDLGLSVKWATCNVGADTPEGYGDYFAWGETSPKSTYNASTYLWCNGSITALTKYNTGDNYATVDNKIVLDLADDAAHVIWGDSWRMPTNAELEELENNCTWTFQTVGGVNGYRGTSKLNGNSIFFPCAGGKVGNQLKYAGSFGLYWSSTLRLGNVDDAYCLDLTSTEVEIHPGRITGISVRPVYGAFVSVGNVSLNKTSLTLSEGDTETLTVTVTPSNATEKTVSWASDDTYVARVNSNGKVTALSAGTAIITATSSDGSKTATCTVTVATPYHAVDMGLSVQWASCNVGASSPEDYGDYFAWGETSPKSIYELTTYQWCNGDASTLLKYNNDSGYGDVDNRGSLELSDDAAHANWGDNWRMPRVDELLELIESCTWTWTTMGSTNGYRVTASNGNSIFLPAAGARTSDMLLFDNSSGYFWTSSLNQGNPNCAYHLHFHSNKVEREFSSMRFCGLPVRPVYGDYSTVIHVNSISLDESSITMTEGTIAALHASVSPTCATDTTCLWTTSNSLVATVSSEGSITAVGAGTAVISAISNDGGKRATCIVTVTPATGLENGYDWVDLGLSVKWAQYNVGASAASEAGLYFAWGETSAKSTYSWENYAFRSSGDSDSNVKFNKYNTLSTRGTVDNKTTLELSDDAAHVNWGGNWRMPTESELEELISNCTYQWTTMNGKSGCLLTSKKNGRSIFFRELGWRYGSSGSNSGSGGYYWTSSLYVDNPHRARSVSFGSVGSSIGGNRRYWGMQVRAVME